ncbi:MAG: hypothetical protein KAS23_01200, partial [Anaerohalosphaera sp.]|nr:hypothetical protein [Anaerohalosphaera sp.]
GIRTPGTLVEYASLANWWIKPLSHLSGFGFAELRFVSVGSKQHKSKKIVPLVQAHSTQSIRPLTFGPGWYLRE